LLVFLTCSRAQGLEHARDVLTEMVLQGRRAPTQGRPLISEVMRANKVVGVINKKRREFFQVKGKRSSQKGLTRNQQITILAGMGVLTCLILCAGGYLVVDTLNQPVVTVMPFPTLQVAQSQAVADDPTPFPMPPTWTPEPSPTPDLMNRPYTFVSSRCEFKVPSGADVECGYVIVPESRQATTSTAVVRLAVAIYRSTGDNPAPDPILFLNGGPGAATLEEITAMYKEFIQPFLKERDFITFDQRGTGFSEPNLSCPEYRTVAEDDWKRTYSEEKQAEEYPHAFRRCRDRLTTHGANLAAYTSTENAADVKDLVTLLGYQQVNLYGASYGTRLALTVMRDSPEVIRSVVLDGVEPIEVPVMNQYTETADRVLRKLFDDCAADRACNASYPRLEAAYYALVDQLNANPEEIWVETPRHKLYRMRLTGTDVTSAIFGGAYVSEIIPYMPAMIYSALQGDYQLLALMVGIGVDSNSTLSEGMYLSVNCHEEVFATTADQMELDYEAYPDLESFAYDSVFGAPETLFTICNEWGAAAFEGREGEPVVSDLPTLVLVGEYDPITPPNYAQMVAQNLSYSYFYEFRGQGHTVGLWQSECAAGMVREFVTDPWTGPNDSCVARESSPDFK